MDNQLSEIEFATLERAFQIYFYFVEEHETFDGVNDIRLQIYNTVSKLETILGREIDY